MKRITTIRRVVTSSVMTLLLLSHVAAVKAQTPDPNPQAIWTADNNTLTFVDWEFWYRVGDTFNGHTVTAVWDKEGMPATGNNAPGWSSVASSITTVVFEESFQNISPTNCCKWFANCQSLQTITGIENLNTSGVTNMSEMFSGCWRLTSLDVSSFDTSNVTNMEGMFFNCSSLTSLDLSNFNTSNVTSMSDMFRECTSLTSLDVTNFDTRNVTSMWGMFCDCSSLTSLNLSNFNTSSVVNMVSMFDMCYDLTSLDVTNFDTSKVTTMRNMFYDCSSLTSLDLSNFDTSKVTDMSNMFNSCSSLTTIYCDSTWTQTNSSDMFAGCTSLVGGAGTVFNVENPVVDATYAHPDEGTANPGYFTIPTIAQAIWTAGNTTLTFISSPTTYAKGNTFDGYTVTAVWSGTDVTASGNADPAWMGAGLILMPSVSLNLTKVVFDDSFESVRPTSLASWFKGCGQLTEIQGISNLNTSEVTNMSSMFDGCRALTSLNLSNFNTSNVTNMSSMFNGCSALTSLNLSNFNTSNVTNMSSMFNGCRALTSLDVSSFNTSNVTDMGTMFNGCRSLTTIVCDDTWTPTSSTNMFADCTSLVGGLGTKYDASHIDAAYARVDDAFTPGYFTPTTPYIPQAIWTADNTTLTFVNSHRLYQRNDTFNGKTVSAVWSGTDVTASGNANPAWSSTDSTVSSALTNVVFDSSFASVCPTSLVAWFCECSQLTAIEGISNLNTSKVTNMRYMFRGCSSLKSLNLSNFDTSRVTNMGYMFYECMKLKSLVLSDFDTSNVIDMSFMFYYCSALTSLDLSDFDTSNVKNMLDMFEGCSSLTSLDLTNFDTRKVTAMGYMFYGCNSLTTIFCDNTWRATTSSFNMFLDCTSLVGGAGTTYNSSNINAAYAHPDGGTANPGYFTSSTEVITANKPGDKETYWATYYYSGSNTVALPAEGQNVKIYTAEYREVEGQRTLILTEVTDGVIKAGQGVIIESTNQQNVTMKHSLTRAATGDYAQNALKGRDNACALPTDEGTIYTMGNVDGQLGFYKYTGLQLNARRAYLAIPAGSEAGIRIRFDGEDTATGIDEVQSTTDKVQSATIYDLQGRRVVNPTKGIYIVNGKKVYMK